MNSENWTIKKIGQIAETYAGGTPLRSQNNMFGGKIPWVKSSELNYNIINDTEEKLTELGYRCSSAKWIPANTPLIAMYGATAGVVSWLKISAVANQAVLAVVPNSKKTDSRWLYWILKFYSNHLIASVQGSGQPNLNKSLIDNLVIKYPPTIEEQQQIAKILDTVDKAIAQTETLIAKYKRIKIGLMQDLLTRGIDENGQLRDHTTHKFKPSALGMIPDEWDVVKLSKVCSKIGVGIATSTTRYFVESGIPLIRNQNISETGILMDDIVYISQYFSEINSNKKLKKDDILMVRTGYPGISCLVTDNEEGWQSFTTLIIRPNSELIFSPFLVLFLNSWICKKQINNLQAGGAQQNLNAGAAENVNVILIKKESEEIREESEQKTIYNTINSISNYLNSELSYLEKLQKIKTGLMQDLLTGKISVKPLLTL